MFELEEGAYHFIIEKLGLFHCDGPSEFFHGNEALGWEGSTNTCRACFNRAKRQYLRNKQKVKEA